MSGMRNDIIIMENIILGLENEPYEKAIKRCGKLLTDSGYVNERYTQGMLAREESFSTAIGNFIAIPHGEKEYKEEIIKTGLAVLTYPQGIEWGDKLVYLVIGIAAKGEDHLDILENIVTKLEKGDDVMELVNKNDKKAIHDMLVGDNI